MSTDSVEQMKWWGWGDLKKEFEIKDKPNLWPYITTSCGMDPMIQKTTPPKKLDDIHLPLQKINQEFIDFIDANLSTHQIKFDKHERLLHCYGKSFRDLWRIRNGIVNSAPDAVCYPESENDVLIIIKAAVQYNVVIIPFGGGSNIAGCLEALDPQNRMVVSLDLKKMNKILEVNCHSMTARIQAGAMGPLLEKTLNKQNMTLGHFPDSFEYSSIGGWIATRSAGMKSDKYGKIEDMVISLRVVTPLGVIETRTVPKSSNGIDINHLCIGSEGIFGVITEATMEIHPLPERNIFLGYIFPDFESGTSALYECATKDCLPAMTRLNDAQKTMLSFAFKSKSAWVMQIISSGIKYYLKNIKRFDMNKICLLLVGFEGDQKSFLSQKKKVHAIYKRFGAVALGKSPGQSFEKGKYDFPYLRDLVMDYGITVDVSETSATWSNLQTLYSKTMEAACNAITETGSKPWCGCHISHTYRTGASLYFTFAFKQSSDEVIKEYLQVKKAVEDSFMKHNGTLSHHHAVGYEHMPWIIEDISLTGAKAIHGIKMTIDPKRIMNPGKIIPNEIVHPI